MNHIVTTRNENERSALRANEGGYMHRTVFWPTLVLSALLSMTTAQSQSFPRLPETLANPHHLTTESSFATDYTSKIWPHFVKGKEGTFLGNRGTKLYYRMFLQQDRSREKGAIVISSGRTEGLIIYPELIYDLGQQGYSVYIHDHRGQGFSGGRLSATPQRGYVDSFDDYVVDLKTFVYTVVLPQRHRNLYLLAHSMGGGIASIFLEQHPGIFKAAILISPMHDPLLPGPLTGKDRTREICTASRLLEPGLKPTDYALGQNDYVRLAFNDKRNDLTHSKIRWENTRDVYDAHPVVKVGGPTHGWIRQACDAANRARKDAGIIKIPVLLIQAGQDTAVRNKSQDEFCSRASKCTGFLVFNSYHAMLFERDDLRLPTLNKTIDFLDEQSR